MTRNSDDETSPEARLGDATRVVQAGRRPEWTAGIVNPPVWRASTILYDTIADLRADISGLTRALRQSRTTGEG